MWKKIDGFNYSINENGEVRNDVTGKIKSQFLNKSNHYLCVELYENNVGHKKTIHRLLAEAFIPNPDNKPTVDHKDGNRQNNALSNLRWATYSEQNSRFGTVGIRSERIKVTHYPEIRNKTGWGHVAWEEPDNVMYFERITDCAKYFDVTGGNIRLMLKCGEIGRRGKMRGYSFEYLGRGYIPENV